MNGARIYKRQSGGWGSSCDGTADTGHHIYEHASGKFSVWSIHDEDLEIADKVVRADAERAIAFDWRHLS